MDEIKRNQSLVGLETDVKNLLDKTYKIKGFSTRGKYIKYLLEKDNEAKAPIENTPSDLTL